MLKAIILIIIGIAGFILGAVIALCGLLMFNGLAVSGIWSYVILFTTLFFPVFTSIGAVLFIKQILYKPTLQKKNVQSAKFSTTFITLVILIIVAFLFCLFVIGFYQYANIKSL